MDGLLLVDKPVGMTSFDVVRRVRKLAKTRKVGHTGTLDPEATGLLPIVLGKCTKLANFLVLDRKEYTFEMHLGVETSSGDIEGEVLRECAFEHITGSDITRALDAFVGEIAQVPPKFSAVRVDGKRAYELARKGVEVEMKPRTVVVHALELLAYDPPVARMKLACGAGTYVRSLARDLGEALGSCAHARAIRRTRVGSFSLEDAHSLAELEEQGVEQSMLSPAAMVASLPRHVADPDEVVRVTHGHRLPAGEDLTSGDYVAIVDEDGELVAVAIVKPSHDDNLLLQPKRVLRS